MATKNNPGPHDCYANADPDEPLFTLLARDRHAPVLLLLWASYRKLEGEPDAVVDEAVACASDMLEWRENEGRDNADQYQRADQLYYALSRLNPILAELFRTRAESLGFQIGG